MFVLYIYMSKTRKTKRSKMTTKLKSKSLKLKRKQSIQKKRTMYGGAEGDKVDEVINPIVEKTDTGKELKHTERDTEHRRLLNDDGVYKGEFFENDGKRTFHGEGTLYYDEHGIHKTYKGEWENGKKHGKGTLTYANGATYEGDWVNGKKHGQGTLKKNSKVIYDGQWKDNEPDYIFPKYHDTPYKKFMKGLYADRDSKEKERQRKGNAKGRFGYGDIMYGDPNQQNKPYEP